MKLNLHDKENKQIGDIDISNDVFLSEPSVHLVHELVLLQHTRKVRTASTKTKSEVRGGGAKPWKQKGTGRARAGSIRSPLWRGGGVIFGPKSQLRSPFKMPKRARLKALCSALSLKKEQLVLIDAFPAFDVPKTKEAISLLGFFRDDLRKTLVLVDQSEDEYKNLQKSLNNIEKCKILHWQNLNPHDVMNAQLIICDQNTIKKIEAWLLTRKFRKGLNENEEVTTNV